METASNVLSSPLKFKPAHVTGGGDQAWAAVELEALNAVGKNGKAERRLFNKFHGADRLKGSPYPQKYCWVMRFNEEGTIVQVRVDFSA